MSNVAVCHLAHCGGILEYSIDTVGRVVEKCPLCERRRAGICRDCPARVEGEVGKALRCARCKREAKRQQEAAWHRDPEVLRRRRARWRKYSKRAEVRV